MSKKPHPLDDGLGEILSSFHNTKPSDTPSPAPPETALVTPPPSRKAAPAPMSSDSPVRGKKSNADYYPTTVFMRKTVSKRVKQALLSMDSKMDVSDVVEMLLDDWLKDRGF